MGSLLALFGRGGCTGTTIGLQVLRDIKLKILIKFSFLVCKGVRGLFLSLKGLREGSVGN